MKKKQKSPAIPPYLLDDSVPIEQRREMLRMTILEMPPGAPEFIDEVLAKLKSGSAKSIYQQKCEELKALMKDLDSGPFRSAVFVSLDQGNGSKVRHAQVILDDGAVAYSVVPDEKLAKSLRKGDRVLLDGRGKAVLRRAPDPLKIGDEALFERIVLDGYIEVSIHGQERSVFFPSKELEDKINSAEVSPGDTLVVNSRQSIAFDALPPADALSHFQYLVKSPVPDVVAERDIGSPPEIIEKISQIIRLEMTQPETRRRFGLRRTSMNLLTGIPGTGKTLSVEAIWRAMYEIASEATGVAIEELPPRVFKLKLSSVLSEWLGRSDKNMDRFFDEVEQMAAEEWEGPDGKFHELPVLVVLEEIDGLARSRGQEAIYDRILTGVLQRLDPNRAALKDKLIIFIGTTNEPQMCDVAMLRRIGSTIEKFGRLDRGGFITVLNKQIAELPIEHRGSKNGREAVVSDLTGWLFSANGSDPGVIEMTYAGATTGEIRYRRDFLTGALVDRAVQQAAEKAAHEAAAGNNGSGVHLEHFVEAFDGQIRAVADQLSEHNAHKYLEVPDAVRVATVQRLPQPSLFPLQLQAD